MNDFSEIEQELKRLRLAQPSHAFLVRVGQAIADPEIGEDKIIWPNRFRLNWIAPGVGVAAAALFLVLAQIRTQRGEKQSERITHFTDGSEGPMRRLRYQTRQTLQWRNARTGESLRVSYPSEEVVLIPISGQ